MELTKNSTEVPVKVTASMNVELGPVPEFDADTLAVLESVTDAEKKCRPGNTLFRMLEDLPTRKRMWPSVHRLTGDLLKARAKKREQEERAEQTRARNAARPKVVNPYVGARFGPLWNGYRTVLDREPASTKEERLNSRFWSVLIHPKHAERLREGEPFVVLNPHSFLPVEEGEVLVLKDLNIHPGVPGVDEYGAPDQHSATVIDIGLTAE
jgi:hypothetical protein